MGLPHPPPQPLTRIWRLTRSASGTYRDLWADFVAERNPALQFLSPSQTLELNPADAERLGVQQGQRVSVVARTGTPCRPPSPFASGCSRAPAS